MRRVAAMLVAALVAPVAWAFDYASVGEATLLFDAPSQAAQPVLAIARGTPVEVVVQLDVWVKVRDPAGNLAWMDRRLLSNQRMLMVTAERAQVHAQPDEAAPLVFEAAKDVLLELVQEGPAGWAKVKHRDGQEGFVKLSQVWGY
jgi:SH3-like domain-containing protein